MNCEEYVVKKLTELEQKTNEKIRECEFLRKTNRALFEECEAMRKLLRRLADKKESETGEAFYDLGYVWERYDAETYNQITEILGFKDEYLEEGE